MSSSLSPASGTASSPSDQRQYKACRTCRRQKMRCDADDGIPCSRCQKAGVSCMFDTAPAKRQARTTAAPNKKQRLQELTDEVATLKDQLAALKDSQQSTSQNRLDSNLATSSSQESGTLQHIRTFRIDGDIVDTSHALSADKLVAPVTAVHVMMTPPQDGEPERSPPNWSIENQSRWNRADTQNSLRQDIVTCLQITDVEARSLFDLFMQGANSFLSLFDPQLDTFDSIRERSPFTLAAILYVALIQQHSQELENPTLKLCFEETRRLAADSLFENPSSLEKAEGMILLAIYAEKTWFALGHTYQIANDLGLDRITLDLVSRPLEYANPNKSPRASRLALRCAKVWLLVLLYERGLAFGTSRPSRGQNFRIENLEPFLDLNTPHPSILSSCASVDLHQHLVLLRTRTVIPSIPQFGDDISAWHRKWDKRLEDSCISKDSLHRSHLRIQELYALIIHGGILFARACSPSQSISDRTSQANEDSTQISTHILLRAGELFTFIENCGSYKRVFPCTPTYECLLLTFVIILGFHVLRVHPALATEHNFLAHVEHAVSLIKQHPCQRFHGIVSHLVDTARSSPPFQESLRHEDLGGSYIQGLTDSMFTQQGEEWMFDMSADTFFSISGGFENVPVQNNSVL